MSENAEYVLGFLFQETKNKVVLIKKSKPEWQAGKLNGIGGKIENGETPLVAIIREFEEETGVKVNEWREFALMQGNRFKVHCFVAFNTPAYCRAVTIESEPVEKYPVTMIPWTKCVSNLQWLIAMAMDKNYGNPFHATIQYP